MQQQLMLWSGVLKNKNRLIHDQTGSITLLLAITLPVMIGFIGLAADTSTWYLHQRNMQTAADATAIATGYRISSTSTGSSLQSRAASEAARNGFGSAQGVTVTTNLPPLTGGYTSDTQALEVILTKPESRFFSGVFLSNDPNIHARAVVRNQPVGNACILALDPTANDALRFQGNTTVNLNGCVAAANSNSGSAVNVTGDAASLVGNVTLNAQNLYTAGTYSVSGSSVLNTVDTPVTNGIPIADPYSGLANPTFSGCAGGNSLTINNTVTLSPTTFCNGLRLNSNADVTLNPGTYYIDRGNFKVNGGAKLRGTNVTIVLTSSTASSYATVDMNGGADVQLSASSSGQYAGLLFYQDRRADPSGSNKFNGNSSTQFDGAVYIPNQSVDFNGGNVSATNVCTQVIARLILFSGNSNMSNNCTGVNQSDVQIPGNVKLVE